MEYRIQREQRKAQQLLVAAAAAHAANAGRPGSMTPVSLAQQMALGGLLGAAAEDLRLHRGGGGGGGGGGGSGSGSVNAAPQTEPLSLSTKDRKGGDFSSSGLHSPSSISPTSDNDDESPSGLNLGAFGRKRPLRTPSPSGSPPPFMAGHLQPPITSLFNSAFPGGFPHHGLVPSFPRGSPHSPPLMGGLGAPPMQGDSPGAHGSSASSGQGGHEWTFEEQFKQVSRKVFIFSSSIFHFNKR